MRAANRRWAILLIVLGCSAVGAAEESMVPVDPLPPAPASMVDPRELGYTLEPAQKRHPHTALELRNPQLYASSDGGLRIDLGDAGLYGNVYAGALYGGGDDLAYQEPRYRARGRIEKGVAIVPVRDGLHQLASVDGDARGILSLRFELWWIEGDQPRSSGFAETVRHYIRVAGEVRPTLSIVEGPIVALVQSDHPDWCTIAFETDRPSGGFVDVDGLGRFASDVGSRHEVRITGLIPRQPYRYRVGATAAGDTVVTPWSQFRAAARVGEGPVVFAYAGDSRGSYGGPEHRQVGVNRSVLSQVARAVSADHPDAFVFGGDLITGYVDHPADYVGELKSFKGSMFGLTLSVPFFTAIGNHETLRHRFRHVDGNQVQLDAWPYDAYSAEALFAAELVQPPGTLVARPGRPPYRETTFTFQLGTVRFIICNNNYWWTAEFRSPPGFFGPRQVGGLPEGYILPDQLNWIQSELVAADTDETVRYVFLVMQEPPFPSAGHVDDAMWFLGDNRVRGYENVDGEVVAVGPGMVEVRNQLWELASNFPKVAAVLCADEHNYQRTRIGPETPVGMPGQDDLDGNGVLDDGQFSPNAAFRYPTWQLVSGGAGAPYYVLEPAPWRDAVVRFSTAHHYLLIRADDDKISMEARGVHGDVLDRVDDLMAIKR